MPLDDPTCYRAMESRDARFDGRFFAAVRTTGIYCRPICPARKPLRRNVAFFPSAAAAERAGFRPCLRCRPDAAPGSADWLGRSALLARAVRLIHAGALNEGSVDALAARLGVSARHLGRLFRAELGASPVAFAQTLRAHFARRLIDETDLPLTEIAFDAGFGSVRRFNTAMKERFGRPPRELRRRAPGGAAGGGDAPLALRLPYRPPFHWEHLLAFLAARAIPGVEHVAAGRYVRSVAWEGRRGWIEVRPSAETHSLTLCTSLPPTRGLPGLVERVRGLFDLRADPLAIGRDLGRDPTLRGALERGAGVRVPGAFDGFELAVRAILGQQVSVKGARTLLGRLVARCGRPVEDARPGTERAFPTAEELEAADLTGLGLPEQRARAVTALAATVRAGELDLSPAADRAETRRRLMDLPGIGAWTADYVAMRALRDPDAFPAGDLVLRAAVSGNGERLAPRQLLERAEAWRPWRAYAAVLLWKEAS